MPAPATETYAARFRRYECKYVVSEATAAAIRRSLQPFMDVDPYAAHSPDAGYDINSLYLDTPDLRLFRETCDGVQHRLKLRIRCYSDQAADPAFLEIKRRLDKIVVKGRTRLTRDDVTRLLRGGAPETAGMSDGERACFDEFSRRLARWTAQPMVWVRYRREAYMGCLDPGVRVTLDRQLRYAPASTSYALPADRDWCSVEAGGVVMELKFNGTYPRWLSRLVQRHGLLQRSYSKYCDSVRGSLDGRLLPVGAAVARACS